MSSVIQDAADAQNNAPGGVQGITWLLPPGIHKQYLGVQQPSETATNSPGFSPLQRMSQFGSGYSVVVEVFDVVVSVVPIVVLVVVVLVVVVFVEVVVVVGEWYVVYGVWCVVVVCGVWGWVGRPSSSIQQGL